VTVSPPRLAIVLAALLATAGLSACGNHPDESASVVRAKTEGLYLDIGELKYQVQVSRQMNPYDMQDKALLIGVPPSKRKLAPDEVWFGVFLRVQNETAQPQLPSANIEIEDTQDQVFKPLGLLPSNLYAYRSAQEIPAHQVLPLLDTPAFDAPARGALLLFKLKNLTLDNRPLELRIVSPIPPQQTGVIDLDV
jgi:hypothetical protein